MHFIYKRHPNSSYSRVTSLEQLSLAEFSGVKALLQVYENSNKNGLGIWINLVSTVNYSTILIFKVIFLCQKSAKSFWFFFFIEEYKNIFIVIFIDLWPCLFTTELC